MSLIKTEEIEKAFKEKMEITEQEVNKLNQEEYKEIFANHKA
jgi:hypothetical protein